VFKLTACDEEAVELGQTGRREPVSPRKYLGEFDNRDDGVVRKTLWKGALCGLAGGSFVVRGIENNAAVKTLAVTFGTEIGLVAQRQVDNAPLARRHGSEVEGSAGLANFFGGDAGSHAEFLEADGALVLAVERYLFMLAGRQAQDFEGQKFEGAEKFAAAIQQEGGIWAGKVDEYLGLLPLTLRRRVDDDAVLQVKTAVGNDGLQEFIDLVGGG